MTFDPDGPAQAGSGIFGLPAKPERAEVALLPVCFDATVSYGHGCARGPEAIRRASVQVDLHDHQFGPIWRRGIVMDDPSDEVIELSAETRALVQPIIERGGATRDDADAVRTIDAAGARLNEIVVAWVENTLEQGRRPGIIGGEHSVAYGAIRAAAQHVSELGVLQIDAHMDLREAYEGLAWSHASVMFNLLRDAPGVTRLVQVGIRDVGERELERAADLRGRIVTHFDQDWFERGSCGPGALDLCREAIEPLPQQVWVSFDIDGLDPSLCPHTGTPVPGGLSFHQACALLATLARSGREVVGFDLVEVCPGPDERDEWDANVGARILYKLCGCAGVNPT